MRKPHVEYQADDVVIDFIHRAAGPGSQALMIGCEILFAAGLATRELVLIERDLTMKVQATPVLASSLELLATPNATRK